MRDPEPPQDRLAVAGHGVEFAHSDQVRRVNDFELSVMPAGRNGWLTTRPVLCEAFYDFAELRSPRYIKIAQERRSRGASY